MMSKSTTVAEYLAELPDDRRMSIEAVRQVILTNLDKEYEEGIQYGMIGYYVPHHVYPAGYHCDPKQPLPFVCLASQKNYLSLYMGCVYGDNKLAKWFLEEWNKSGKKLNMGKSCIRFKKADDLALDVIGEAIHRMPIKKWIEVYETSIAASRKRSSRAKAAVKKPVRKKAAPRAVTMPANKKKSGKQK